MEWHKAMLKTRLSWSV